ncbi:hypothetical protein PHYC_03396 [Phycisphaerales bacterium]|nr:hypothetical protein PHYC_03396 [Phycisphaerales bacterium]
MRPIRLLVVGLSLVAALGSAAPAQSDDCVNAPTIGTGVFSGTTSGATIDGSAPCGQSEFSADVWYRYVAPAAGMLRVESCGSGYDTVVSLHPACGEAAIACSDDAGGACGLGSRVQVSVPAAGTQYLIRMSGYSGAFGNYTMRVQFFAAGTGNDECPNATPIGDGTYSGSTAGRHLDGIASCGLIGAAPDVWYLYTPTSSCTVQFDTCGSTFDTVLAIFDACPNSGGTELACNDDTEGGCGLASTIWLPVTAGTPYVVRVGGYNNNAGNFTLNVQTQCPPPGADDCASAVPVFQGETQSSTLGATPDGFPSCDPGSPDVWFVYTAAADEEATVSTCNSQFDTIVSVHSGCPGTSLNEIGCNDDACANFGSSVNFSTVQGGTYYIRVGGWNGQSGQFTLVLSTFPSGQTGSDVYVGEISAMVQLGREGDTVGCAMDTPLCNAGSVPLDTLAYPDARHPFFVFNMYRLRNNRLEQIGQSWVKHMQGSAQEDACGFGCQPYPDGSHLGVGCSDTYGAFYNGTQSIMGPRSEINPFTGAFDPTTSHLANPDNPPHNEISHRLQIRDADLDPALNAGALYFAEQYTVAHDDPNHMNSVARELAYPSGSPGGAWNFDLSIAGSTSGPAIDSWLDATRSIVQPADQSDGQCILRALVVETSPGVWHYEYALYNHDLDRGVRSFSVPVGGAAVMNIGFHAPRSHDEPFHNNPWTATLSGGVLTWETDVYAPGDNSNPLRWGTLYNFRFDSDTPPIDSSLMLGLYKPGDPAALTGAAPAPSLPPPACDPDVNCDGAVNGFDIEVMEQAVNGDTSNFCQADADYNHDGAVNGFDVEAVEQGVNGGPCP